MLRQKPTLYCLIGLMETSLNALGDAIPKGAHILSMDHACSILLEEVIIPIPDWASVCNVDSSSIYKQTPNQLNLIL